jgi:acetylornithine/N-succinyldiaminopimelate aminotransferase
MAVALAAFDEISDERTLAHARAAATHFRDKLKEVRDRYPDIVRDVRGKGLLVGLGLVPNNRAFMTLAGEHGLLVAGGGENIIRLLPPLNIAEAEIAEVVSRLAATCVAARAQLAA